MAAAVHSGADRDAVGAAVVAAAGLRKLLLIGEQRGAARIRDARLRALVLAARQRTDLVFYRARDHLRHRVLSLKTYHGRAMA